MYFRTIIHSSYSVLVKAEMGSTWERLRVSSRVLPSHLSRILLELEHIQAELINKLSGLTVAATIGQQKLNGGSKLFADADVRSWVSDSTGYQVRPSPLPMLTLRLTPPSFPPYPTGVPVPHHLHQCARCLRHSRGVSSPERLLSSFHRCHTSPPSPLPLTPLDSRPETDLPKIELRESTRLDG
jgi:hypothetical protein